MQESKIKQSISAVVALSFIFQPYIVLADGIKVDTNAPKNHQASIVSSHDGTTVVNIVNPNKSGISHNTFYDFSVKQKGLILNNSKVQTNTALGGMTQGNKNLKNSASLILNEVSGTSKTSINGFMEVAGKSADVIVSNPNGITVNGGGFINTPRATLTTGKVSFDGSKAEYEVKGGRVSIEGKGLDASASKSLDIYTNALQINADIYADKFKAITGNNKIDGDGNIQVIDGEKSKTGFSIDSKNMGGIYANSISLIGTQKGVGVNLPPEVLAQDTLSINSNGQIIIHTVKAGNLADINSKSSDITVQKGLYAKDLKLNAGNNININGNTGAKNSIDINAKNLYNNSVLAAGVNDDFSSVKGGKLDIYLTGLAQNSGTILSNDTINMIVDELVNKTNAKISSNSSTKISANKLENSAEIKAMTDLVLDIKEDLLNDGGTISAQSKLNIYATKLVNTTKGMISSAKELYIEVKNSIKNLIDSIITSNDKSELIAKDIQNDGLIKAGKDLKVKAEDLTNNGGLYSEGSMSIRSNNLTNSDTIYSVEKMYLYVKDTLKNISSFTTVMKEYNVPFVGKIKVPIVQLEKEATIYSGGTLDIAADENGAKTKKIINNKAKIKSAGDMKLVYNKLENRGVDGDIQKGVKSTTQVKLKLETMVGDFYRPRTDDIIKATQEVLAEEKMNVVNDVVMTMGSVGGYDPYVGYSAMTKGFKINGKFYSKDSKFIKYKKISDRKFGYDEYGEFSVMPEKYRVYYIADVDVFKSKVVNKLNQDYKKFGITVSYKNKTKGCNEWSGISCSGYVTDVKKNEKYERNREFVYTEAEETAINTHLAPSTISSGGKMTMQGDYLDNIYSTISSVGDMTLDIKNEIINKSIELYKNINITDKGNYKKSHKLHRDSKWSKNFGEKNSKTKIDSIGSSIISGGKVTFKSKKVTNGVTRGDLNKANTFITNASAEVEKKGYKKIGKIQSYDPTATVISLPTGKYGVFVENKEMDGPLIKSNPLYKNYTNFVGSDYLMDLLDYNTQVQTRRLGDAVYETELVRDAVMLMTGERLLGNAKNDNAQYINLMDGSIEVAKELGLILGKKPTKQQLNKLKKDIVWLEEKTVSGKKVLVPIVYLARDYKKAEGAHIGAKEMSATIDGKFENNGNIKIKDDIKIDADTLVNDRGGVKAGGLVKVVAENDIVNASGDITGGKVYLKSKNGDIINKTITKGVDTKNDDRKSHNTIIDKTASITSSDGAIVLDAKNDIKNIGAKLDSSKDLVLKAGNNVDIKTIKDEKNNYKDNGKKGYEKSSSLKHTQSKVNAKGQLAVVAGNDANLEAVKIKSKDVYMQANGKVNITSVVDSRERESLSKSKSLFSKKSKLQLELEQKVLSTDIKTKNLLIAGDKGIKLESVIANVDAAQIKSKDGDVKYSAKSYTNSKLTKKDKSVLGGLFKSKSVDSLKERLLADSLTKAKNDIVIKGKNIDLSATDLSSEDGIIALDAKENINIISGLESNSQEHFKEKSGLNIGLSGGKLTFAEVTKDKETKTNYTNKKSTIKAKGLVLKSANDTNVIASDIKTDFMSVDAKDFNVISAKDKSTKDEMHSSKKIGVELKMNTKENSLFAGYWENENGKDIKSAKVVKSSIDAKRLIVNSKNANVIGSDISGDDITINSENIRVLADSSDVDISSYVKSIKAGVKLGVKQNLSSTIDAVSDASKAKGGSGKVAGALKAYDAVHSFASKPVDAGVDAIYKERKTKTKTNNSKVVSSSIKAKNSLTLKAKNELEIAGSELRSENLLNIDAKTINAHSALERYSSDSKSQDTNAKVSLFGTDMGQGTIGLQKNKNHTDGTRHINAKIYAGGKTTINSEKNTYLKGATIDAQDLTLNVGGDLEVESMQDISNISGQSRGTSVSGGLQGISGVSLNGSKTKGKKAWVENISGINGRNSIKVNVNGTTKITGAKISNIDKAGVDQGNLDFYTKKLISKDIKDIDTFKSTNIGLSVGASKSGSLDYAKKYKDRDQTTKATIGKGRVITSKSQGSINRDLSKMQVITKDKKSNINIYTSDKTIDLAKAPSESISGLKEKIDDIGLASHKEILNNLPTVVKKNADGTVKEGIVNKALDWATFLNVIPDKDKSGGYITQIATQLFGDNRNMLTTDNPDKLIKLGINKKDIFKKVVIDSKTGAKRDIYFTNPNKAVKITNNVQSSQKNGNLSDMKIYISQDDVKNANIKHLFTNGMNNSALESVNNQQEQQGRPSIAMINYNQTHGLGGDMIENVQDALAINLRQDWMATGSARQTGDIITQMTQINEGDQSVAAHSQGTMHTYMGMKLNEDKLTQEVNRDKNKFHVQFSGSPVNSKQASKLVNNIHGGKVQDIDTIFRSQVNPGDPVAIVLGRNSAGVNNQENYGKNFLYSLKRGVLTIANGKGGENPSPHSGYECVIDCSDERMTPELGNYYDIHSELKESSLLDSYKPYLDKIKDKKEIKEMVGFN